MAAIDTAASTETAGAGAGAGRYSRGVRGAMVEWGGAAADSRELGRKKGGGSSGRWCAEKGEPASMVRGRACGGENL